MASVGRVTKPSDDIFTNVHSLPPTGGIRLEGDREGKIVSAFFFFHYRKKNNIYVSVQRVVRCSHQSDRVGYVSRTNQIEPPAKQSIVPRMLRVLNI